ncbi:MAG: hypothetical protein ACP5SH_24475 [Syntrophobacteraceae bacterium]
MKNIGKLFFVFALVFSLTVAVGGVFSTQAKADCALSWGWLHSCSVCSGQISQAPVARHFVKGGYPNYIE